MLFLEKSRASIFWLIDSLKGAPVKRNLEEITTSYHCSLGSAQDDLLMEILKHAVKTTHFYRSNTNSYDLKNFPIINKSVIREQFKNFISDKYKLSELIPVVTSGSTGTPFKTFQDRRKKYRNYADTIFFANLAGYEMGHRLLYLKIWAKEKMQSGLSYWMRNIIPIDVIHLNDNQIETIIAKMERQKSTYGLLGYASALDLICQYMDRIKSGPVKTNVRSIISMSESLNEYTKFSLEKYFSVPVVSRYSNLENGIIAQQETNGKPRFLINTASYCVEIFKLDSDEPAHEGELGRIVVTDLFNYAMPMIRYDTGDIGAMESDRDNPARRYLSRVEGRKLDLLYDTKGAIVSSYIAYKNMWKYTEIIQYQLIQEGEKDYIFKINVNEPFKRENQLIQEFKSFLGFDANFTIQYVNEIPLLASGKRKKVVNNYKT